MDNLSLVPVPTPIHNTQYEVLNEESEATRNSSLVSWGAGQNPV